jgi:hypothetical protein
MYSTKKERTGNDDCDEEIQQQKIGGRKREDGEEAGVPGGKDSRAAQAHDMHELSFLACAWYEHPETRQPRNKTSCGLLPFGYNLIPMFRNTHELLTLSLCPSPTPWLRLRV